MADSRARTFGVKSRGFASARKGHGPRVLVIIVLISVRAGVLAGR